MAGGRRARRLCLRHGDGAAHAALSRAAADGDHAADRPHGVGQRLRRLGPDAERPIRHQHAALHAGGDLSRWRLGTRIVRHRPVAALALSPRRRHRGRAGDLRARRNAGGGARLAAADPRPGVALQVAAVPVRPRLPRAASREPGLPAPRRRRWRAARLAPLSGRAGHPLARQRHLRRRSDLVSQLPLQGGAGARARLHRGPRVAGHADLGSEPPATRHGFSRQTARPAFPIDAARGATTTLADVARERSARAGAGRRACTAPPMPTSSSASAAGRSSPAIRGSPTGAATRSSRCAVSASPPAGSTMRAASCWRGRRPSRRACCRIASPTTAKRRSSTRSTRRCGTSSRCTTSCRGGGAPSGCRRQERARVARRGRRHPRRLRRRHALRHPLRRRRPAQRRRGRRAAHVDGRQGRRLGGDAAHRQAGRGAGAVAQRAGSRQPAIGALGGPAGARARGVRRALLEPGARLPIRRRRLRPSVRYH